MAESRGYIDLQVNGYGGIDFHKDDLTPGEMDVLCDALERDGVEGILATITTEAIDVMARRLRRIVELRERDERARRLIIGIHIEGPFLNPGDGFRGAHLKSAIHPADAEEMKRLLDAAGGLTRIVTLAPENDPRFAVIRMLDRQGVIVSAGHCDASLEDLKGALDAGLSLFTHLGNGCPMYMHRHDNIIQRALSLSDRLRPCFIADGVHVSFPALTNYLRAAGLERSVVVTDAMAAAGKGPGRFQIGHWDVLVGEDLVVRAPDGSHFIGSAMSMPRAMKNLIEGVGLSREQAQRLTVANPKQVLGLV